MNNVDPAKAAELQEKLKSMSPEEIAEYQRSNCIFCKVISGEIDSKKLYSDDKVFVILDINPANDGHILILPKEHYPIMPLVPKEIIDVMSVKAKEFSSLFLKTLGVKGSTLFIANGAAAGQKAQHFMMHLIPRNDGDGLNFSLPSLAVDVDAFMAKLNPMFKKNTQPRHEKHIEEKPSELVEDDEISVEEEGFMEGEEKAEEILEKDSDLSSDITDVDNVEDSEGVTEEKSEDDEILELLGGKKKKVAKKEDNDEKEEEDIREQKSDNEKDEEELEEEDRETQEEIDEEKEDEEDDRHDKSEEINLDEIGGLFR